MCVSTTPTSNIDLNFNPPSWLEWMKLLAVMMNWSLSPITFSISLPIVLSRTIGLKDLGVSYDFLFSLGIATVIDLLKCKGQYSNSIQALAMQIMLFKHLSSLRMILRWLHNNLSGPEIEALLQFAMAILNSSFENGQPEGSWFIDDFIKNINVHLMMESCVESGMKCVPQVIDVVTLLTIMFDGFDNG